MKACIIVLSLIVSVAGCCSSPKEERQLPREVVALSERAYENRRGILSYTIDMAAEERRERLKQALHAAMAGREAISEAEVIHLIDLFITR